MLTSSTRGLRGTSGGQQGVCGRLSSTARRLHLGRWTEALALPCVPVAPLRMTVCTFGDCMCESKKRLARVLSKVLPSVRVSFVSVGGVGLLSERSALSERYKVPARQLLI